MNPGHTFAERVIANAWDFFHRAFTTSPPGSRDDLNIDSSIIHKLTLAVSQLKSFELKLFDRFLKEKSSASPPPPTHLTPEQLEYLDRTLGLID